MGLETQERFTVVAPRARGLRRRPTNTHAHKHTNTHGGSSSSRGFKPSRPTLIKADRAEERHVGPRRDKFTFLSLPTLIASTARGDVDTKRLPPTPPPRLLEEHRNKSSEKQTLRRHFLSVMVRKQWRGRGDKIKNKNCKSYQNKLEQTFRTAATSVQK